MENPDKLIWLDRWVNEIDLLVYNTKVDIKKSKRVRNCLKDTDKLQAKLDKLIPLKEQYMRFIITIVNEEKAKKGE